MTGGIGQILKLLDMVPDKKGKKTFIEKLPSAQKLDGGNLSGLMGQLQGGGLGQLFQNPMSSILGPLQSLIGAVGQAQGGSSPAFAQAAQALGEAVTGLQRTTDLLSGVAAPGPGEFGQQDMLLHEGVIETLGASAPASMAVSVVAAPLYSGQVVSQIADRLYTMNLQLSSNLINDDWAAGQVNEFEAQIKQIVQSSNDAISAGEAMAQNIAQVHTAAAMLAVGSDTVKTVLNDCIKPDALAAMNAAMTDRLTIRPPDDSTKPSDTGSKTVCY